MSVNEAQRKADVLLPLLAQLPTVERHHSVIQSLLTDVFIFLGHFPEIGKRQGGVWGEFIND